MAVISPVFGEIESGVYFIRFSIVENVSTYLVYAEIADIVTINSSFTFKIAMRNF